MIQHDLIDIDWHQYLTPNRIAVPEVKTASTNKGLQQTPSATSSFQVIQPTSATENRNSLLFF